MVRLAKSFLQLSILVSLVAAQAHAAVLFEAYAKILSGSVHTGYIIQRYEVDKKSGNFMVTAYTRTGPLGGDITESLKAVSGPGLVPISYSYTSTVGSESKIIDATFKKGKMSAKVLKNKTPQTIEKPIEKGMFLSSFLVYLILQSKDGLKKDTKYSYKAIAEEDPEISTGEAFVEGQESYKGQTVFKILNTFKDTKFVSYLTPNGEVLMTKSPLQGVATEVVADAKEAIGSFPYNPANLKTLFGEIPAGKENAISKSGSNATTPTATENQNEKWKILTQTPPETADTPKKQGVSGDKGLILKGEKDQ